MGNLRAVNLDTGRVGVKGAFLIRREALDLRAHEPTPTA